MDSRQAILTKIRAALKAPTDDAARRATVAARLGTPTKGIIPARGQLPAEDRVQLFRAMAEKYSATTERIGGLDVLPATVSSYLKSRNLPAAIRIGADARLASAPWSSEPTLEIRHGASDGHDLAAVSHAFGAFAETGTLAMLSGPDNPVTLNFLPEHHIVVLSADEIAGDMETIWERLRAAQGAVMPRTVNFITGPSRSADIEQTLLLGAHGPRALHIVIVGEASAH